MSPAFGKKFVDRLGPLQVCHQVFIPRPTASVTEPIRISSESSVAWHSAILPTANSSLGLSIPIILLQCHPQVCHPLNVLLVYLPPLFPSQETDAAVLSALAFVRRCRSVWRKTRNALVKASRWTKAVDDHHRILAPRYACGQRFSCLFC